MDILERLAKAIGYPEEPERAEDGSAELAVDDGTVRVRTFRGRTVLWRSLGVSDSDTLRDLAGYASGRLLKEEAVLAWDPEAGEAVLWQDLPETEDEGRLRMAFEVFCASCDWWLERCEEFHGGSPEGMILG